VATSSTGDFADTENLQRMARQKAELMRQHARNDREALYCACMEIEVLKLRIRKALEE